MNTKNIIPALIILFTISCNTTKKTNTQAENNSNIKQEITSNNPITEKYWKLKTLAGKDIKMVENQEREQYFILKMDGNRVTGFSGCNNFNGSYTLEKGNRIHFTQMLSTLKACPNVNINESEFLKIFNLVDNYTINGDTLNLNIGRRAPLAVFEAVYF